MSQKRKYNRKKKYRRNRRRIQVLVMMLGMISVCIFFLSGKIFGEKDHMVKAQEQNRSAADDSNWSLKLVNQWNHLPEGYAPNLKEVDGGEKVDERIYEPLMEMLEAAKEINGDELPTVVSGYRTQEQQQQIFDKRIEDYKNQGYSEEEALETTKKWVALPGTSEHQLGLAVDINGVSYDLYLWLQENSYKYGFIFRYPGDKSELTGIAEEVWHYRYVGKEAAADIYEQGICLEEYTEASRI